MSFMSKMFVGDTVCPLQAPALPMIHKMSVVVRVDVFSNSGLAPKIADVARDVYFRSIHPCQPVKAQC